MKPSREEVREAWHEMDAAEKAYRAAREKFDRLLRLRYPSRPITDEEMAVIDAALKD